MAINCLIVDDSRVLRTVARRIFEEMRFDVAEAEDGFAAQRACREKIPDLILFDGNLPGMKGVDFLKKRARPAGRRPSGDPGRHHRKRRRGNHPCDACRRQ